MQVGEIDDIAMERAIEDVAERAAQHHAQRRLVDAVLLTPHPDGDSDRDGAGQCDKHPASDVGRGIEQAERDADVLGVGELEEGQQVELVADVIDAERAGDDPLHELVEAEHGERDKRAEGARLH